MSTGLKNKIPDDKFFGHKGQEKAGKNLCKIKTGATKEIKWLRKLREKVLPKRNKRQKDKVDWEEPKNLLYARNPSKGKKEGAKKKTAGFKAESFLPTPSEEESQL